jgi:hypothetical protein
MAMVTLVRRVAKAMETSMDYAHVGKNNRNPSLLNRLRLILWSVASRPQQTVATLDVNAAPAHVLKDLGIESPSRAWDETVAFWR